MKGTVIVFGLIKLQANFSPSHWLGREGMREEGWGFGGNQLIILHNIYSALHTFGQKINDGIYIHTVQIVNTFFVEEEAGKNLFSDNSTLVTIHEDATLSFLPKLS
jgi:hypothetical protein